MFKEKLNQIKVILGLEVKLASDKLVDGTAVEAEEFAPGFPLFVLAEDGTKSPAPAGEHETESGLKIEVDAEGKIISAETKAEAPEVEVEVKAAAEGEIPASENPEEIAKKEEAVAEAMKKIVMAIEEISTEVSAMKTKMTEMESKYEKFSKTPGAEKAPKVTRGEFNAVNDALDAKIATLSELKSDGFFRKA